MAISLPFTYLLTLSDLKNFPIFLILLFSKRIHKKAHFRYHQNIFSVDNVCKRWTFGKGWKEVCDLWGVILINGKENYSTSFTNPFKKTSIDEENLRKEPSKPHRFFPPQTFSSKMQILAKIFLEILEKIAGPEWVEGNSYSLNSFFGCFRKLSYAYFCTFYSFIKWDETFTRRRGERKFSENFPKMDKIFKSRAERGNKLIYEPPNPL